MSGDSMDILARNKRGVTQFIQQFPLNARNRCARFIRAKAVCVLALSGFSALTLLGQAVPPGTGRYGSSKNNAELTTMGLILAPKSTGSTTGGANGPCNAHYGLLPISRFTTTDNDINCFYNTTTNFAFTTEAKYLYNPGGNANIISGSLAALNFPGGVQLSLIGNAKTGSCSSSTTSSGASTNSSCGTSDNGGSTPSLQQDVQTITQGGDFALQGFWPWLNAKGKRMQFMSVVLPRMGFEVSGLSAQNTATGATNVNGNFSSESYFQLDAIPPSDGAESPGSIFVDYRGGWEGVSSEFRKSAGLERNSFGLQQFSAGLVINGFMRLSAQRYFGPEQAYVNSSGSTVDVNNFKSWQLVVQITPSNVKKSTQPTTIQ